MAGEGSGGIMFSGEGGGNGGGDGGSDDGASVLFPDEGGEKKPDDDTAGKDGDGDGDGDGDKSGEGEWKEYVPDPDKSDEENAAAKAEHDKTKPADGDGDKGKKKDDAAADADKVPDDGKYDLKMPDGVELDAELADALGPEFKEIGLTRGQAQKLADKFIEIQQGRAETYSKSPEGQWSMSAYGYFKEHGTPDTWPDKAKADKEIGGDNWDGTVATARRAVNALGTPELKSFLEASGGGNHPELIRFMARAGAMIKEDDPAKGGAEGAGKPAETAHVLFPNDAPKG
jgi:hypothetical protein